MWKKLVLILVVTQLYSDSVSAATSKVVCYHGTWAHYRNGQGSYQLNDIDPTLCTHLIYSFIGVSASGEAIALDSYLDNDLQYLKNFNNLKSANPNLKTLVAMGGWNLGSAKFSNVAASATLRSVFVKSVLEYVQKNNFDGFDFDWEYPAQRDGAPADKQNFITLVKETKEAFKPYGLLVTAAVAASASSVALSYDVPRLSQYLDFINVMTYDLHASWDGVLGHNAPLYASSVDTSAASKQLNVDASISYWISSGADPAKIILGVPFYGRSFALSNNNNVAVGAPSSGPGTAGPYTLENGYLGYNEIVEKQLEGGWTYVWDNEQQVPHMYKGNQWVGFDDPRAIRNKAKYAQDKKLGGVMVWAIETDDFRGLSGVKNPLLRAINEQLGITNSGSSSNNGDADNGPKVPAPAEPAPVQPAPQEPSAPSNPAPESRNKIIDSGSQNGNNVCTKAGYVRDPKDCSKFYHCSDDGKGSFVSSQFTCSSGLYYDVNSNVCNWKESVTDCA